MQSAAILLTAIVACVLYGVLHDQVTARICIEYFTVGHPPLFRTTDPTLLAIGGGVVATWWVGALLGIPLAVAARLGCAPKRSWRSLLRPIGWLAGGTAIFALVAGGFGYFAASYGFIRLSAPLADRVAIDRHIPFLIAGSMHVASYGGGGIGGAGLILWVWRSRRRQTA